VNLFPHVATPTARRLVTLTTDFGLRDEYVGVMKGVLLGHAPMATVIDLCHEIAPQDIRQAALLLEAAVPYFPAQTLHVAVVDPGVGGRRTIVLVKARDQLFLAPDNGILSAVLSNQSIDFAHEITTDSFFLPRVGRTFHGRDIFAPVAAAVLNGVDPVRLGPPFPPGSLQQIHWPSAVLDSSTGTVHTTATHIDRFGNIMTNLREPELRALLGPKFSPHFQVAGQNAVFANTYSDVPVDTLILLGNSRGYLEIALNQGNAARLLHVTIGMPIPLTAWPGPQ